MNTVCKGHSIKQNTKKRLKANGAEKANTVRSARSYSRSIHLLMCSILSNALTSSYFIFSLAFICLPITSHTPPVPLFPSCQPAAKTFPCSFLWTSLWPSHLFSSLFWGLHLSHLCLCQARLPFNAISLCYGERSRLYKDQYEARESSSRFCSNLDGSLYLPSLEIWWEWLHV